jgi:hypothetical protein
LEGNLDTIQKNTESLLDASKEVGLEVNSEKTKYMLMSRKKAGQKHGVKIENWSFEGVAKFKYLWKTLTDQIACRKRLSATKFGECLLPFGPKSFVFSPAV